MVVQCKSNPLDGCAGIFFQLVHEVRVAAVRSAKLLNRTSPSRFFDIHHFSSLQYLFAHKRLYRNTSRPAFRISLGMLYNIDYMQIM